MPHLSVYDRLPVPAVSRANLTWFLICPVFFIVSDGQSAAQLKIGY